MTLVLPQPPAAYDVRDQTEIRRLIALEVFRLQQAQLQLVGGGGGGAPSGTLEITGGDAASTYEATDTLDGGSA